MSLENPLVSVITPTYKRGKYISRALISILNQTYRNIEIIIIDDNIANSEYQKETMEALAPYLLDPKIHYIQTPGAIGGGAARNYGLQYCNGFYITFLDDDDRFLPDKVERQVRFMQENDLEMSYQDVQWFNEKDQLVEFRKMDRVREFTKEGLLRAHITYSIAPTSIYMIKHEALLRTDGFGEVKRGQDFILMIRCIEAGLKIGYMSGAYVIQYLHDGERISVGPQFIEAHAELHRIKKSYSAILTRAECRYLDFRFYAVCAFASVRGGQIFMAAPYAVKAFFTSPLDSFKEAIRFLEGRRTINF